MKIDQAKLEEYGLLLLKLKLYPYFDIAHYILMCLVVREDIHSHQTSKFGEKMQKTFYLLKMNIFFTGLPNFHKRHPLACYFSSMLLCFGGGMIVHALLGEPILDDFKTHQGLALASICW